MSKTRVTILSPVDVDGYLRQPGEAVLMDADRAMRLSRKANPVVRITSGGPPGDVGDAVRRADVPGLRQQVDHLAEVQAENDDLRRQMQGAARALALTEMVAVALAEGHARRGQVAKALGAGDDADPKAFLLGVIEMMRDGPTPAEAQLDAAAAIIAGWR